MRGEYVHYSFHEQMNLTRATQSDVKPSCVTVLYALTENKTPRDLEERRVNYEGIPFCYKIRSH